jgi:tetratricopeptide (TPR) repeat protein
VSTNRRTTILMATLLGVLGYYFWTSANPLSYSLRTNVAAQMKPPLSGQNSVELLDVRKQKNGTYVASVKYYFTGAPGHARLFVSAKNEKATDSLYSGATKTLERGHNTIDVELNYPYQQQYSTGQPEKAITTDRIVAAILGSEKDAVTSTKDFPIVWPPSQTYHENKTLLNKPLDKLYDEAVGMIDDGTEYTLASAKRRLEIILSEQPQNAPAHIELARVAMKTNWGSEGLFQAEQFIATALKYEPDSANAKVLQGYVFAHQKKFAEAEKSLGEARDKGTKNLWLWANWGELLEMQNKSALAAEKYTQALQGERPRNTYDRAREHAYRKLFKLYEKNEATERVEALHKQRVAEFPEQPCHLAEYAMFRTTRQSDAQSGKALARDAIANGCKRDIAKEAMGVSSYYLWASMSGEQAQSEQSQARINFPESPMLLAELAKFESGVPVIKKLVANGLQIDQAGNERSTALAVSLTKKEHAAARRLLRLGAKHTVKTQYGDYPLSLIPLMNNDIDGIKLMREYGVDYSKLKWGDTSAVEMARRFGSADLLKALGLPGLRA